MTDPISGWCDRPGHAGDVDPVVKREAGMGYMDSDAHQSVSKEDVTECNEGDPEQPVDPPAVNGVDGLDDCP